MMISLLLLGAVTAQIPVPDPDSSQVQVSVSVDSGSKEVHIEAGPFDLPDMSWVTDHSMSHDTPVFRFTWPLDGWFRGFRMSVVDQAGNPLPNKLLHHIIVINYDRRQLIYPAAERLWGAGIETGRVEVPKSIGIPLKAGTGLGMYIAWHNSTGHELPGVRLRISMLWMPRNQMPRPLDVFPFYADVNLRVGGPNEFDIPPGHSVKTWEFTLPVDGRLIGAGGHMHDYGTEVRLEDVASGRVLTRVKAVRRPDGSLQKIERHLFGVWGEGLKLHADHPYRVVAVYDNPTNDTLVKGAMASVIGLFAPSDPRKWPQADPADPQYQKDLRFLARRGAGNMDMGHMHHAAPDSGAAASAEASMEQMHHMMAGDSSAAGSMDHTHDPQ
jgi:hypothetical protein